MVPTGSRAGQGSDGPWPSQQCIEQPVGVVAHGHLRGRSRALGGEAQRGLAVLVGERLDHARLGDLGHDGIELGVVVGHGGRVATS